MKNSNIFEEYQNQNHENRDEMLKKIKKNNIELKLRECMALIIVIAGIVFIKLYFNTVTITSPFRYPPQKTRGYVISVNNEEISSINKTEENITLIPYFLYFKRKYNGFNDINGLDATYYGYNQSKYIIDIKSYKCFYNTFQVQCSTKSDGKELVEDVTYNNMRIIKIAETSEEIYNGQYITDISKYLIKSGDYQVEITGSYDKITSLISFKIRK